MYRLHVPALPDHVAKACRIAQYHFGVDRPSDESDAAIHAKNPYQLVTVTNENNDVVAYADVFVLQEKFYRDLIENRMTEHDLKPEHFLPWPAAQQTSSIYMAGAAVFDRAHEHRPLWSNALLRGGLQLMDYYMPDQDKSLDCTMIAYSVHGERIASRLGFSACGKHVYGSVYKRLLTRPIIDEILGFLPPLDPRVTLVQS